MDTAVAVWLEGFPEPVGLLASTHAHRIAFQYSPGHLARTDAIPLSLSLPLNGAVHLGNEVRFFFDNLLPENDQLREVMAHARIDRSDIVGLMRRVGADCPGAISCLPLDAAPLKRPGNLNTDYEVLSPDTVFRIVRALACQRPFSDDVVDPSPVAGVQRKIALARLPDGRFALPRVRGVPTTHILKVPERGVGREPRLETAAAALAAAISLDVALPEVLVFDDMQAILVPRFDRIVAEDGNVSRIHQEDFAQALGLPAELKYARSGTAERGFDAQAVAGLMLRTRDPGADAMRFLMATFFNLAIGNTDNHAKNHALLHDDPAGPRLAPLYDLLPIRLNPKYTHELAFGIGDARFAVDLTKADLIDLLGRFGVVPAGAAIKILRDVIIPIFADLDQATLGLGPGLKDFHDFIGNELSRLAEIIG